MQNGVGERADQPDRHGLTSVIGVIECVAHLPHQSPSEDGLIHQGGIDLPLFATKAVEGGCPLFRIERLLDLESTLTQGINREAYGGRLRHTIQVQAAGIISLVT